MRKSIFVLSIINAILLMGCNHINTTKQMSNLPALPDELQVGHSVLSQDSITAINFPIITEDQRMKLRLKSFAEVPDSTRVIGVREIEGKCTLEAYLVPLSEDPNDFEVYLMTRGSDGWGIETMIMGSFHTSEHQGPMRFGGNRFYTLDTSITFDSNNRFTVHHVMTLTSLYLKDHSLTEAWRVEWDNLYEIAADGHFQYIGQQETYRSNNIDDPVIDDFKSRDLR